jgi:drug/metabolite transporter (DMT)-like permease
MATQSSLPGIICLIFGVAVFSVQDLILKLLSDTYPLHQAMVLRSLTAVPILLVIVWWFDGSLRTLISHGWPAMLGRGLLNFVAYTAYYLALAALPLPTTVALYFTAPLIITILSVVILREHVSVQRWLAVAAGFGGVLLMVRPGSGLFDWAALLPVFCGFAYALSMIMARSIGKTETAGAMAFWGNIAFLVCAAGLSVWYGPGTHEALGHPSLAFLTRGWVWPTAFDAGLMCLCGVIAAVGLTLLTQAYRVAQSSTVAPFEFTFMFWGVLWGWIFWRDLPDTPGWVGIAIIIGAGLYVLHRERVDSIREAAQV